MDEDQTNMFPIFKIFDSDYKKYYKKHIDETNKNYKYYLNELEKPIKKYTKENILNYLENYKIVLSYEIAELYYEAKNPYFTFTVPKDLPILSIILSKSKFHHLALKYASIITFFHYIQTEYVRSFLTQELYKKQNIFNDPYITKMFSKIKNYDNNNPEHRYKINFPINYLQETICPKLNSKFNKLCSYDPFELQEIINKYKYSLTEKINNFYDILINILYIIEIATKLKVCSIDNLINKYTLDQINYDLILYIKFPNSNHIINNPYRDELKIKNFLFNYNSKLPKYIQHCIKESKFIIINISLLYELSIHANILIYNPNINEVEIFDGDYNIKKSGVPNSIFKLFIHKFFNKTINYIPQNQYITHSFQKKQEQEIKNNIVQGHCVSWVIWYVEQRLKYPYLNAKQAFNKINQKLNNKKSLSKMIVSYVKYVRKQHKFILEKTIINKKIKQLLKKYWKL